MLIRSAGKGKTRWTFEAETPEESAWLKAISCRPNVRLTVRPYNGASSPGFIIETEAQEATFKPLRTPGDVDLATAILTTASTAGLVCLDADLSDNPNQPSIGLFGQPEG